MTHDPEQSVISGVPVYVPEWMGLPKYTPYKDSVQMPCEQCGSSCWVGPRQQAMKQEHPDTPVICMVCLVLAMRDHGWQPTIHSLGNTHEA